MQGKTETSPWKQNIEDILLYCWQHTAPRTPYDKQEDRKKPYYCGSSKIPKISSGSRSKKNPWMWIQIQIYRESLDLDSDPDPQRIHGSGSRSKSIKNPWIWVHCKATAAHISQQRSNTKQISCLSQNVPKGRQCAQLRGEGKGRKGGGGGNLVRENWVQLSVWVYRIRKNIKKWDCGLSAPKYLANWG